MEFYRKAENVIEDGITRVYGTRSESMRYPKGTQIVVREAKDEILVICHVLENAGDVQSIDLPFEAEIIGNYYSDDIYMVNSKLIIPKMEDFTAKAVILKRKCLKAVS